MSLATSLSTLESAVILSETFSRSKTINSDMEYSTEASNLWFESDETDHTNSSECDDEARKKESLLNRGENIDIHIESNNKLNTKLLTDMERAKHKSDPRIRRKKSEIAKKNIKKRSTVDKECRIPKENSSKIDTVDKEHRTPKDNSSKIDTVNKEHRIPKDNNSKIDTVNKEHRIPKDNSSKIDTVNKEHRIPKDNSSKIDTVNKEHRIRKDDSSKMGNVDKERKISKDNGNKRGTVDKERDVPKYNSSKRYIVEKDQSNKRNTVDKEHKIPKEDTVEKEHSNKRATVNKEYKNVKENCRKKDIVDKEHSHKRHTIDKERKVPNENRSKRDNIDKEHKIPKENNSMRDNIEQERKIPKESRSKRDNVDKDRKIPKENNNTNATVEKENENKRATVDKGYRIPKKNYSKRDNVDKERKIPKEISNATDTVQRENTNKRAVEKEYSNKSATVYKGYRIPKKNCNTSASVKKEIIKKISNKGTVEKEIPKENNNKRVTFDEVIPKDNSNEGATVDNEISIENKRSAEKETKKNIKKRPFEKDKNKARKNLTAKFKDTKKKTNRDDKRKYTQKGEMFDMLIMDEDQLMKLRNEQRAAQSFRRFPHKCYSCIFGFIGEKQLLKHNTYAHSAKAGAFACEICDSRLGDPRKLAVHKKQHYVCIKCRKCDERFTMRNRQAAYRHYQLHEKNQKPVFRKRYNIFRVVKLNDRKMQRMRSELLTADWYLRSKFRCDQCVINFPSCAQREYHARTRHHESVGRYICAICTLRTPSKSLLEKHISAHYHCYECTECNAKFLRKDTADTHYRRAHRLGKIFFCDYCTDTFMKQRDAVAHRDAHTSFPCRLCGRVFTTHKQLNAHLNQLRNDKVHNGTASGTRCTTCDRLFTSEIKLQRHLMSHKPRACTLCDRTFATPKHLYAHCKQAHRKRKPSDPSNAYCVECDKQLGSYSSYRKHVALKHGPGPSVYPCSKCEKIFQADRALRSHYNLEHLHKTDFRCDICDKCFITSGSLKRHQQYIHAGVPKPRKHVCDLCDRAFTAKLVLENHRRTHTGERPFKCDKCKASFTQKVSLQIHIKKVHGFEPKESNEEPKESNEEPKKSNELIVPRYVVASARRSAARKQCEDKNVPSGDIVTTTREQDVLPIEVQVEPVERDISLLLC